MSHRHTGHGPDRKSDCPGCEEEYHARLRQETQAQLQAAYEREERVEYDREILERTLVYHWPSQTASCLCGWDELGKSFPEHAANMYEASVKIGHACDPRRCCADCRRHVTPHRGCILR